MKMFHKKFETAFERFAALVYRRKYIALSLLLLLTGALAVNVPNLTVDTRDESFFKADDPALIAYNTFRDTFGQDDLFMVCLQSEEGLTEDLLNTLHRLHNELAQTVPYLDDITSLVNGRIVQGRGETLIVDELMKTPPANKGQRERMLGLIERYPLYDKLLVSEDRTLVSILIKATAVRLQSEGELLEGFEGEATDDPSHERYLSNEENIEIAATIRAVLEKYRGGSVKFHLAGTPAVVAELTTFIERDMRMIMPLSFLLIIFFLLALFRRASGVFYPLAVVFFSLAATLGIMAIARIPITPIIQILPSFLIVVGIGDSVHIMTVFYRIHRETCDKRRAIIGAVGHAGLPVLMTSLTTACGLLSFALADVANVAQLGYVAPAGVMLAFVYTVVLLPAMIALFPMRPQAPQAPGSSPLADRVFSAIARITTGRPVMVSLIAGIIVAGALWGATTLRFSHNILTWFPEESPVRVANELLDAVNGGTVMLEVTLDTGRDSGLVIPDLQRRLDEAVAAIPKITVGGIRAAKAWSIADVLKETNRALHGGKDDAYHVPATRDLIAQELLLFESSGSDDLEDFADRPYRTCRLSILAPFTDAVLYRDYIDRIETYLEGRFPEAEVTLTGRVALFMKIITNVITSMAKSYAFALVVITILMTVMIGRIRIGLLSMVANVAPVICILGFMGFSGIPLDLSTILVGSIALGLVVDDTIHFLYHFRRAYDETACVETAVRQTLLSTGRALVITSMVLAGGFLIYMGASLESSVRYGQLVGSSILFALAADFFLVPALLSLALGRKTAARGEIKRAPVDERRVYLQGQ